MIICVDLASIEFSISSLRKVVKDCIVADVAILEMDS